MRKYLTLMGLAACLNGSAFSQEPMEVVLQKKMDDLKRAVTQLSGIPKVDALNRIVDLYQILDDDNQMQVDSATPFARQAITEATQIGYTRGLGYAKLKLAYCEILRADIYFNKNKKRELELLASIETWIKQAMQIGENIKDPVMVGSGYMSLARLERLKGNKDNIIPHYKKAIEHISKPSDWRQKNAYREMEYTFCKDCVGNEYRIAETYMEMAFFQKNQPEAFDYLNRAISHYEKAGVKSDMIGNAYMRYATVIGVNTNTETAIEYFKKAIPHFQFSGNKQRELSATTMVSASYWAVGDYGHGFEYSKKSISLTEKLAKENPPGLYKTELGKAFYWMGRFYAAAGDYETALRVTRKGHDYFSGDKGWTGNWSTLMGDIHRSMKNYDSSLYYLASFEQGSEPSLGKLYLAILLAELTQYDKAMPLINLVLEHEKQKGNLGNLGRNYNERAIIWLGKKNYPAALKDARMGLKLIRMAKKHSRLADSYHVLSDIFFKMRKFDSAYYYLKQNNLLKDSFLNRQLYILLNDYKKEADEAKKEATLGFLFRDNKIKEAQLKQEAALKKFLILGMVLLLTAGMFIFQYLTAKRKNEKLLREQADQDWKLKHLDSEKKQADLQRQATELEMQALRAQMNPHFIFNCLSSINRFILKNETNTASSYLTRFSRLIRMVLINSQKPLIALEDELQMLRIYLDMERLRFKDSFDYSILFLNTMEADNIFIPPLLLQPFCENAIWHGLMHKNGQGRLSIELGMEENILNCTITDNGVGRIKANELNTKSAEKEKSMGLKITTERLALLNQDKGVQTSYEIEDLYDQNSVDPAECGDAIGTKVILKISVKESVDENITARY